MHDFLQRNPLAQGMAREELRSQLGYERAVFNDLLALVVKDGALTELGSAMALPDWKPSLSDAQRREAEAYLASLRQSPFSPPTENRPAAGLFNYLLDTGAAVDVGSGVAFAAEAFQEMVEKTTALAAQKGSVSLAEVRDLFGTSRRYAQPFIEYLDSKRITLRRGDEHVLGPAAPRPSS